MMSQTISPVSFPLPRGTANSAQIECWHEVAARSQMWERIVETANDPIVVTTADLSAPGPYIVYVNHAFTQLTGYNADEVTGQTPRILQGPLTDRTEMKRMKTDLEAGRSFVGETVNYNKDGQPYFMEWSVYGLRDERGEMAFFVAVQRDVSARKNYERQIEEQTRQLARANAQLERVNEQLATLSLTDSLTGIANHRALHTRMEEEIARAVRHGSPLSLLMIDVDRFKLYNDTFGHPEGDKALQQIAQLLRNHGRSSDLIARHGGEEFAVLLPQTDQCGALILAEELRAAIENASWPLRPITVSVGVAALEAGALENAEICSLSLATNLMSQADQALYCSKVNGRNCVKLTENCVETGRA